MWNKIWNWIKDHIVLIGIGILSILTLGKYAADRRDDRSTVSRDNAEREREINNQSERVERTIEVSEEFVEECRECIESAEDTVERLQDRSATVESAAEEIRRRLAQAKDEK